MCRLPSRCCTAVIMFAHEGRVRSPIVRQYGVLGAACWRVLAGKKRIAVFVAAAGRPSHARDGVVHQGRASKFSVGERRLVCPGFSRRAAGGCGGIVIRRPNIAPHSELSGCGLVIRTAGWCTDRTAAGDIEWATFGLSQHNLSTAIQLLLLARFGSVVRNRRTGTKCDDCKTACPPRPFWFWLYVQLRSVWGMISSL